MKSYQEYINEVGDKPLDWEFVVKSGNHFRARFQSGDIRYDVDFDADMVSFFTTVQRAGGPKAIKKKQKLWEVQFSAANDKRGTKDYSGLTGTGNSIQVMSTIRDIILTFVKREKPEVFVFGANKDEKSRVALYKRFWSKPPSGYEKSNSRFGSQSNDSDDIKYYNWKKK